MSSILENFSLKGKVALVTGSSTGLGQGMSIALASQASDYLNGAVVPLDGGWLAR